MLRWILILVSCFLGAVTSVAETVRLATFNVENYLEMNRRVNGKFRPMYPKPEMEKSAVRSVVHQTSPDVLALQEFGPAPYLEEFRQDLAHEGSEYPYSHLLEAADPERHVAVLSKIPFRAVVEHAEVEFNYFDEHEWVKRGMLEVTFEAADGPWTVFIVHLKSRYTDRPDDPNSETRRVLEARKLRDIVRKRFPDPENERFAIVGDFNDTKSSRTITAFLRRGKKTISQMVPTYDSRDESWTHFYRREDVLSRVDYLLASAGLWPRIVGGRGVVFDGENAREGSDHRLVYLDLNFDPVHEKAPDPETDTEASENQADGVPTP